MPGLVRRVGDVAQVGDDVGRRDLPRDGRLEHHAAPQPEGPDRRVGVRAPALGQAGDGLQRAVGLLLPSDQALVQLVHDGLAVVPRLRRDGSNAPGSMRGGSCRCRPAWASRPRRQSAGPAVRRAAAARAAASPDEAATRRAGTVTRARPDDCLDDPVAPPPSGPKCIEHTRGRDVGVTRWAET